MGILGYKTHLEVVPVQIMETPVEHSTGQRQEEQMVVRSVILPYVCRI